MRINILLAVVLLVLSVAVIIGIISVKENKPVKELFVPKTTTEQPMQKSS